MSEYPQQRFPLQSQRDLGSSIGHGRPQIRNPIAEQRTVAPASRQPIVTPGLANSSSTVDEVKPDIYRSHTPFSFVIIGGQIAQIKEYSLTKTDRPAEPSAADISISLDAIDSSVFANFMNKGDLIPVEIWSGYLTDSASSEDQEKQIAELRDIIASGDKRSVDQYGRQVANVRSQRKFSQRFSGYVSQPEWTVGNNGKMIRLSCRDWLGYLQEFKFYDDLKDSQCTVTNIFNKFNREITGIKIQLDQPIQDRGGYSMANPDSEDGKRVYSARGKSYQNVLSEICDRLGLKIFISGTTITLRYRIRSPFVWKHYHGSNSATLPSGNPIGTPFDEVKIMFGAFGQVETSRDFIVQINGFSGSGSGKKAASRKLSVKFPENQQPNAGTKIIVKNYPYGPVEDKEKLKIYAESVYRETASRRVTMSMTLGFANPFLDLYDAVEFVGDGSDDSLDFVKSKWFEVTSINESYSESGYTQTIEGRNNSAYPNAFEVLPAIPPPTTRSNQFSGGTSLSSSVQPPPA